MIKSKYYSNMKKVLIVDDEPSLRSTLVELLGEEADLEVFEAEHGVAALQILKTETIDLILLDLDMPFLGGAGVIAELQRKPKEYAQPEIIILTNRGDMDTLSQMVSLNMFEYLIKSDHSLEKIITIIRQKLAQADA